MYIPNGTILESKTLREKQGLNIYTDDDDNALIIRLYIAMLLLFATTRSVFKSVKVSVVEIAKRTN